MELQQFVGISFFFFAMVIYCANLFEALNSKFFKNVLLIVIFLYDLSTLCFIINQSFRTTSYVDINYFLTIIVVLISTIALLNKWTFEHLKILLHANLTWERITHRTFFPLSFYILLYPVVVLSLNSESNLAMAMNAVGGASGMGGIYSMDWITELMNTLNLVSFQITMFVMAFIGTGIITRRTIKQCISRLNIGFPKLKYVLIGILILFAIDYAVWEGVSLIGNYLGGEFAKKTVEESSNVERVVGLIRNSAQTTIQLAIVSTVVGIGEELLFRGALQPRFGNTYTSILFASLHFQYLSVIALLEIFIISYILGMIKEKSNTTTTIIIHILYDFVSLLNILP
jgi:hypothetical protein